MNLINSIAVFDVGKTNKKVVLFDEQYKLLFEESCKLDEVPDEDGFPSEDLQALTKWINQSFAKLLADSRFTIKAVNFSAYGATLVCLGDELEVISPIYNYLKPFPPVLLQKFYNDHGGAMKIAQETASPILGNLNAGLQLYRIKYERPDLFERIKWAMHLPQYISYIFSSEVHAEITSIGCHTLLWHFQNRQYHQWVMKEGIGDKLPGLVASNKIVGYAAGYLPVGAGLHDSSAALIPYLSAFHEPFVLISTGAWCISLNPFNDTELTSNDLSHDCLCYLSFEGKPVKASRLFAGYEHEQEVKRLSLHFNKPLNYFLNVAYNPSLNQNIHEIESFGAVNDTPLFGQSAFANRRLENFENYEAAYHQLIADLIVQQIKSTRMILGGVPVKRIFVDGGFSNNDIYMHLLAGGFPSMEIYAATVPQASALGAALALHEHWNTQPLPTRIIELKQYSLSREKAE